MNFFVSFFLRNGIAAVNFTKPVNMGFQNRDIAMIRY